MAEPLDLEALKQRVVAVTMGYTDLQRDLLAALERIPELEREQEADRAYLKHVEAISDQYRDRADSAEKALREMTASYHTVCVQVAAFEEAAEKVAHAPRAGRDPAISVLCRVLEGYVGTRISVEEDELERLRRVASAARRLDERLNNDEEPTGEDWLELHRALHPELFPALLAPASGEEGGEVSEREQVEAVRALMGMKARAFQANYMTNAPFYNLVNVVAPALAAAREENGRLSEMLRRLEWQGSTREGFRCCPWCDGPERDGHLPGCELAMAARSALAREDGEPATERGDELANLRGLLLQASTALLSAMAGGPVDDTILNDIEAALPQGIAREDGDADR